MAEKLAKIEGLQNALDIVEHKADDLADAERLIKDNIDYLEEL